MKESALVIEELAAMNAGGRANEVPDIAVIQVEGFGNEVNFVTCYLTVGNAGNDDEWLRLVNIYCD